MRLGPSQLPLQGGTVLLALFLQLAASSAPALAQATASTDSQPTYSIDEPAPNSPAALGVAEVVAVDGATKDQLYSAALAWFGTGFTSAKATIDVSDSAGGQIIAKPELTFESASFMGGACARGVVSYVVSITVKDGRYKYEIGNFVHSYRGVTCDGSGCNYGLITDSDWKGPTCARASGDKKNWPKLQAIVRAEVQALMSSLKPAMAKAAESDW
jgi:hypothetical protein